MFWPSHETNACHRHAESKVITFPCEKSENAHRTKKSRHGHTELWNTVVKEEKLRVSRAETVKEERGPNTTGTKRDPNTNELKPSRITEVYLVGFLTL